MQKVCDLGVNGDTFQMERKEQCVQRVEKLMCSKQIAQVSESNNWEFIKYNLLGNTIDTQRKLAHPFMNTKTFIKQCSPLIDFVFCE